MRVLKKDSSEQLVTEVVIAVSPVHFEHSHSHSMLIVQKIVKHRNPTLHKGKPQSLKPKGKYVIFYEICEHSWQTKES